MTSLIAPRVTEIAPGVAVRRALPTRALRTVGAWCFLDHFGPVQGEGMRRFSIGPHPHIGLQTATWLIAGELLHRDSIGSVQRIRAGELNLMTAGKGIAHSELLGPDAQQLHGLQFWIALPDARRHDAPSFEHHATLPRWREGDVEFCLFVGALAGRASPATVHTPLLGLDVHATASATLRLPLDPSFEHALYLVSGTVQIEGTSVPPEHLWSLPAGPETLHVEVTQDARFVLLGGRPFDQPLLTWWNFVARDPAEIEAARDDWEHGRQFGVVADGGEPIKAPPLDLKLRAPSR